MTGSSALDVRNYVTPARDGVEHDQATRTTEWLGERL
jgi:hypothetical protein